MPAVKKTISIVLIAIVSIAAIILLLISPITKFLIEKYDEKFTGRKITLDWAYTNPFTGYIHLSNIKMFESNGDTIFFKSEGLNINFALLKMLNKTYEISELTFDRPYAMISQNKKIFNFNDLLERFSDDSNAVSVKAPVHFSILKVKIIDGVFYYFDKQIPINYFIKKVNLESTGKRWDADTVATKFSFHSGLGSGAINGNITMNVKSQDYHYAVKIEKLDLNIIEQYLKDFSNYGSFSAILDADLNSAGNFNDRLNVTTKGKLSIYDFHLGKTPKEDYASFKRFTISIKELSPKKHIYYYDSMLLNKPFIKYERYDHLDNLQTMFGVDGENIKATRNNNSKFNLVIEIAMHIRAMSVNFFKSQYKINHLAVSDADIQFNDYSLSEKFAIHLSPLNIKADSIDRKRNRVEMAFHTGIKPYGDATISLSVNPKDSSDFDMHYTFQKISAAMFNPYIITYTSFPLDKGTIQIKGSWNVRNGEINSKNHLVIIDPRTTKRIRNKDTKWIPAPLIMAFVRERGNVIDYDIPIKGDLKDPKFNLWDILGDLFENVFVKPVTTPYRMEVKNLEMEIEKSFNIKWEMRKSTFKPKQEQFIEKIVDFLVDNPEETLTIHSEQFESKEKEYLLFFEAKKNYFLAKRAKTYNLNEQDSMKVELMSIKDSLFLRYLDQQINDSLLFTVQEKCTRLIGTEVINTKYEQLNKQRHIAFTEFFKQKSVDNRLKFFNTKTSIPYNGYAFYKVEYNANIPESLLSSYKKLEELDEKAPREKYKKERNKSNINQALPL